MSVVNIQYGEAFGLEEHCSSNDNSIGRCEQVREKMRIPSCYPEQGYSSSQGVVLCDTCIKFLNQGTVFISLIVDVFKDFVFLIIWKKVGAFYKFQLCLKSLLKLIYISHFQNAFFS